jgi:xylan 1,4-beta-xylosidase
MPGYLRNPVLPGFEPDPSIVRVGHDYYIATSTFEWYPGVRLHHSRDLAHWRPAGGALRTMEQLDLRGVPDSGGIWAPCLSYADGLFHLVYTVVDSYAEGWKDIPNYIVTAPGIEGPWSDPVYLHSRGWDPSLFHDEDRSWLLNMIYDWRPGRPGFAGIEIQEYDRRARKLLGQPRKIFGGTEAGVTEGPNLYRRDGWYYLVVAEGGTGTEHQVTVARSRELFGPYQADPAGPALTAKHDPALPYQKAGHGSLVHTPGGDWYMAHLLARPYRHGGRSRSVLGRETAIQRVEWSEDGWPRVPRGVPHAEVPVNGAEPESGLPESPAPPDYAADWSTLRRPASPDWIRFSDEVTITGGQSPTGRRAPSLLAHRVTSPWCSLRAEVEFEPASPDDLAGVAAYYNTRNWHYVYVTAGDDGAPCVAALSCIAGRLTVHGERKDVQRGERVALSAEFNGAVLRLEPLGVEVDATTLSDEHADEFTDGVVRTFGFTGAMLGLWAIDLSGSGAAARFGRVTYRARHGGIPGL